MPSAERVSFVTSGHDADERFIREYVAPALDRLEAIEGCRGVRFSRFGGDPRWDRSEVKLGIYGDYDAVIDAERDRWNELVADGVVESWSRDGAPFEGLPEDVQVFLERSYVLASHMSTEYFDAFEERPALVGEHETEGGRTYGFWTVVHVLLNQMGYTADEEAEAYVRLFQDRVVGLTEMRGHDHARDVIADARESLDELEARVDELEEQGGFAYYSGPD